MTTVFKDLQKLVSAQQQENARNELYDRLIKKPFWIWDREQHKQEDIRTDGDCCFRAFLPCANFSFIIQYNLGMKKVYQIR